MYAPLSGLSSRAKVLTTACRITQKLFERIKYSGIRQRKM